MTIIRDHLAPRLILFLLALWFNPLVASAADLTGLSLFPQNPTLNIGDAVPLIATGSYDTGVQLVMAQAKQVRKCVEKPSGKGKVNFEDEELGEQVTFGDSLKTI